MQQVGLKMKTKISGWSWRWEIWGQGGGIPSIKNFGCIAKDICFEKEDTRIEK